MDPKKAAAKDKKDDKAKGKKGKKGGGEDEEEKKAPTLPPSEFCGFLRDGVQTYLKVWQDRDESNNFQQKHDAELIKEVLRPGILQEVLPMPNTSKHLESRVIMYLTTRRQGH